VVVLEQQDQTVPLFLQLELSHLPLLLQQLQLQLELLVQEHLDQKRYLIFLQTYNYQFKNPVSQLIVRQIINQI